MTNSISDVAGRTLTPIKPESAKVDGGRIQSNDSEKGASNIAQLDTDRVELSVEARSELDKAGFDAEKVDQIKQAIADGNYPIDAKRIAEGFSNIEKLL